MFARFRAILVILSIALQALEAVVGGLGHSFLHRALESAGQVNACASHAHVHQHGGCGHHHHPAPPVRHEGSPAEDESSHDDCSLCRHFAQSVLPAALDPIPPPAELVAEHALPAVATETLLVERSHDARGPPSFCA